LVNDRSPWFRVLAMAGLLAAFVVTARGGLRGANREDGSTSQCELTPPREADGLERCLALNPGDIEAMLDLGSIYETQGRADRAEAMYRLALSVDPKDADVHVRLGLVLLHRGDEAEAAREAHTALQLQPRSSRALALLEHAGGRARK
jgi:Flp pilus assembly protein TadD